MTFQILKKTWISKVDAPDEKLILSFIGRPLRVKDDDGSTKTVRIDKIMGSLVHPNRFEIVSDGKHYTIVALDFFGQMNGEHFTDEEIRLFDEQTFEVKKNKWQKTKSGLLTPNQKPN